MRGKTDVKCLIHFNCMQGGRDSEPLLPYPEGDLSILKQPLFNLSILVDGSDDVLRRWIDHVVDSLNKFPSLSWLLLMNEDLSNSLCCLSRLKNAIHTHRLCESSAYPN